MTARFELFKCLIIRNEKGWIELGDEILSADEIANQINLSVSEVMAMAKAREMGRLLSTNEAAGKLYSKEQE